MKSGLRALLILGGLLAACSGGGGSTGKLAGGDASMNSLDGGRLRVPGDRLLPGDQLDIDGDGKSDGVAIDVNGDGAPDGLDTDGDGAVDQPIPGVDGGAPITPTGNTPTPADSGLPFPVNGAGQVLCGSVPCVCSDGLDNDSDGITDLADPECVSSWDNDEGSFATGIPGDNRDDACQDCFFDGNSGSGNDGCRLPSSCLTDGTPESGQGSCNKCEQSDQCKNFCEAYTPNGCDCFGCCDVRVSATEVKHVLLAAGCDINGTTLTGCMECVPSTTCVNTCGECELCPGKTIDDLPASCTSGGDPGTTGGDPGTTGTNGDSTGGSTGVTLPPPPAYTCDNGGQFCGGGFPACPAGSLCEFGCCVLTPILF